MSQKSLYMLGMTIGSIAGGYLPSLFGVSAFSYTSILTSALGGILGIYLMYKWTN
ncbi:hypothetical protein KBD81_01845 [Candidatus Woesebacteria bacterium]|nr:hypothetical protein [Candidatus Woesebacteria bacterium]